MKTVFGLKSFKRHAVRARPKPKTPRYELSLDGSNGYVDAGNNSSLDITDSITLAALVRPDSTNSVSTGARARILNKYQAGPDRGYILDVPDDADVEVYRSGISGTYLKSPNTIKVEWMHVTTTYDGSSVILYENGKQVNSTAKTGAIATTTANFIIGKDSAIDQFYFKGSIREVRIYNRALSATEVYNLFAGESIANGLVLHHNYKLGHARDLSGNENDGTLVNGAKFNIVNYEEV